MLDLRLVHVAFFVSWFLFIFVIEIAQPARIPNVSVVFPAAFALIGFSEIGLGFYLRASFIGQAETVLRTEPENHAAKMKWRTGSLLSFCFAETITLFGVALRFLGFGWNIAGVFFAVGLLLLILWTPRKIETLPPGVR